MDKLNRREFFKVIGGAVVLTSGISILTEELRAEITKETGITNFNNPEFYINSDGVVYQFYGNPKGWIKCDGSKLSKRKHPKLYKILKGLYPQHGDNSNVLRVPDLRTSLLKKTTT